MPMNYRILVALMGVTFLINGLPAQVISIAQARAMPAGSSVTVRGMVTSGAELGRIGQVLPLPFQKI